MEQNQIPPPKAESPAEPGTWITVEGRKVLLKARYTRQQYESLYEAIYGHSAPTESDVGIDYDAVLVVCKPAEKQTFELFLLEEVVYKYLPSAL